QAVREYIVITDELRDTLSRQSHATWGHYIDEIIRKEKRRIRDQVLTMYQTGSIEASEAALFIPAGEFPK
ncbi:TPA: plasmid transfer ATPase TraJ, partial [Escherichia coli]